MVPDTDGHDLFAVQGLSITLETVILSEIRHPGVFAEDSGVNIEVNLRVKSLIYSILALMGRFRQFRSAFPMLLKL